MTPLSTDLIGTWELISREDRCAAGEFVPEPTLGNDPLGLLIYDGAGRFALQLMKRKRGPKTRKRGYDAYFGTYVVDDKRGVVTQSLQAALAAEHVGSVVTREMAIDGDTLTIRLNATSVGGEAVTRTLRWRRIA